MFQLSVWSIAPLLAALVTVGTYLRLRNKQRVPGVRAMLALLATLLFWTGSQFLETVLTDLPPKFLLLQLSHIAITLVPVLWFVFALTYARRQTRMRRRTLNALCVVPVITILLIVTNGQHGLVWSDVALLEFENFIGVETRHGLWFPVHTLYSYGLIVVATVILAYTLTYTQDHRGPVLAVIAAPLVIAATNLFHLAPWNPVPWFDINTVGFAVAIMVLDHGVLRNGVLENIPVLRDRVVTQLNEGVVVLGADDRVVDINPAALTILGAEQHGIRGTALQSLLAHVPLDDFLSGATPSLEMHSRGRTYDITSSPLHTEARRSHRVLVIRDVTARKDTEQALRDAQEDLKRLAHTDPLTGLYNRRLFMARLEDETRRAIRHAGFLSVLVFDLDHFKQINDTYGHDAGDEVLKAVAMTTQQVKRASDIAARMGGEEFALLLPETGARGALQLGNRLREAIEAIDAPALIGANRAITASVGVASISRHSKDPRQLLKLADNALYRAKNGGRNQVRSIF